MQFISRPFLQLDNNFLIPKVVALLVYCACIEFSFGLLYLKRIMSEMYGVHNFGLHVDDLLELAEYLKKAFIIK